LFLYVDVSLNYLAGDFASTDCFTAE